MAADSNKPATLHDVANLAGVSYQTVSRVINNSPYVAEETRKRVHRAIKQLDYRPNRAARSLITGRSQTLQMINFNSTYTRPVMIFVGATKEFNYHLGISMLNEPSSQEELRVLLDEFTSRIVDGFIFFEPPFELNKIDINRLCRGAPFVQVGSCPCPNIPAVVFDQRHGVEQIMNHLLGLGHRQIAEISGILSNYDGRVRHEAFLNAVHVAGLKPGPSIEAGFTTPSGYAAACALLDRGEPFTALVCANDEMALGALRALHEHGVRVPEDISVTGFDDNVDVPYYEPPLTTVRQDLSVQAHQSIQYLVTMIEQTETPRYQQIIFPQLVIRQSTLAPRV